MNIKSRVDLIIKSNASTKKKVLELCELVRGIPYKRIGSLNPQDMIKAGKGSCTPKHVFLATYLKKLGIPVKFLIIPFYYKKLPLKYPKEGMDVVKNMPISYHTALKAEMDGKWRIIDATWDTPLKKLGFVINENWNGDGDMKLGVIPEEVIEKNVDPRKFEKGEMRKYTNEEADARVAFYKLLDKMIETCRN